MTTADTLRPASDTIGAACALLGQLRAFVGGLDDDAYARPCAAMQDACVGAHVRHTLDHFRAALRALEGETVDYDTRARDTDVEKRTGEALREIDRIASAIGAIEGSRVDEPVTIRVMLTGDGARTELTTSLARELAFATHHAVHHNAMMSAIARDLGAPTPEGFGKAPSTIDHESRAG